MCRATLTLLLVLQMVPSHVLAQGIAPRDHVGLLCAEGAEPAEPKSVAVRSLIALQQPEGLNGPARFGVFERSEWLQQVPRQRAEPVVPPPKSNRGWIGRHPALFGALVGAAAGTVLSLTMENEGFRDGSDEDCLFHGGGRVLIGAGAGAGIGSFVGWLVGLGSK